MAGMVLPNDPTGLPSDWKFDPTHKDPNGMRFRDGKGTPLDFHKGREGAKGWKGKNHWHYNNGKPHLPPGSKVPNPAPYAVPWYRTLGTAIVKRAPLVLSILGLLFLKDTPDPPPSQ